jgi:hypothetical protein
MPELKPAARRFEGVLAEIKEIRLANREPKPYIYLSTARVVT